MVRVCCPVFEQGRIDNDTASNKRRRHTPDQIVRKLAEGNVASLACPVRRHEGQRGQRLKELKAENAQLTEGGAVPRPAWVGGDNGVFSPSEARYERRQGPRISELLW